MAQERSELPYWHPWSSASTTT